MNDIKLSHHVITKWIAIRRPKKQLTWEESCLEIRKLLKRAIFKKILPKTENDDRVSALYTVGTGGKKIRFIVAIHKLPYTLITIL